MLTIRKMGLIALAALAGCAQTDVRNAGAPPGGTVTTIDKTENALLGWMQVAPSNVAPGVDHWTRMRVVAPAGATECRTLTPLAKDGPQDKGKPDAQGIVMLTGREGAQSVQIACDTPGGVVRRTVTASVYTRELPPQILAKYSNAKAREYHVLPPLVHVDPRDPGAETRWTAIASEICPVGQSAGFHFACQPGMLEAFKAADLGEAG